MHSDTESLAFMEEDDVSPLPRNAAPPPPDVPRPRIMAAPGASPSMPTPTRPPLHHPVAKVSARPGPAQMVGKPKGGRPDTASEFSDNESVNFVVDNNSLSGTPMRGGNLSFPLSGANAARGGAPRRLSRAGSTSSIHFNVEPGSRPVSPHPRPRPPLRSNTPAEKSVAPHSPPQAAVAAASGQKAQVTNDSISFFFDQSDSSDHNAAPSPIQASATARGRSVRTPVALPLPPAAQVISNDSIAFQVDEDSGDGHGQTSSSPSAVTPLTRAVTTTPSSAFSAKAGRPHAGPPISNVADTSHNEFVDNSSIAFDIVEEAPFTVAGREAKTTSPPFHHAAAAMPTYNSHARRSLSAASRGGSRPNSPSIQFEWDHNSDEEGGLERSALHAGGSSPSTANASLPQFERRGSPPPLPMPEVMKSSTATAASKARGGKGGGDNTNDDRGSDAGSTARSTKKTIVTNHLQRRQQQQQQRHSRLPSPQSRLSTRGACTDAELAMSPSTHPPLYQKSAVSTPIAAHAAGAANAVASDTHPSRRAAATTGAGERNLPKKKDPTTVLALQRPEARRSRESAVTSESLGASPNAKVFTEAGSTGTTDSPPEPLQTGRHSRSSTDGHLSSRGGVTSHATSVQGYLANQEAENVYHRSEYSHHAQHDPRTERVLYREVSPPAPHGGGVGASAVYAAHEVEQWRRFNEQQRAELAELRHRIAHARRQDRTLLESSAVGRGRSGNSRISWRGSNGGQHTPQPAPLELASLPGWSKTGPGYSDKRQSGAAAQALMKSSTTAHPSQPTKAQQQQQQQPASVLYAKQMSSLLAASAQAAQRRPHAERKAPAASTAAPARQHNTAAEAMFDSRGGSNGLLHSAAAAAVADLLGVLWPPRIAPAASLTANRTLPFSGAGSSVDLYFVNGSRLTAAQVERFLDLVRVQVEAQADTHNGNNRSGGTTQSTTKAIATDAAFAPRSLRGFSPTSNGTPAHHDAAAMAARDGLSLSSTSPRQRAPLSAKLSALLPKKAVRRSRVMREVFDVMDLKRQGCLVLDLLPSLARLFEGELASLEEARMSLLAGRATPVATLLESAIASRQQYAAAWGGRRGGGGRLGDGGSTHSLSQVLAADGAGLTAEAQEALLALTHRLLLLSFAVNVVIPIASASRIPLLDFPALCMILYAAVDNVEHEMDSPREQWREVVQQYFMLLDA